MRRSPEAARRPVGGRAGGEEGNDEALGGRARPALGVAGRHDVDVAPSRGGRAGVDPLHGVAPHDGGSGGVEADDGDLVVAEDATRAEHRGLDGCPFLLLPPEQPDRAQVAQGGAVHARPVNRPADDEGALLELGVERRDGEGEPVLRRHGRALLPARDEGDSGECERDERAAGARRRRGHPISARACASWRRTASGRGAARHVARAQRGLERDGVPRRPRRWPARTTAARRA